MCWGLFGSQFQELFNQRKHSYQNFFGDVWPLFPGKSYLWPENIHTWKSTWFTEKAVNWKGKSSGPNLHDLVFNMFVLRVNWSNFSTVIFLYMSPEGGSSLYSQRCISLRHWDACTGTQNSRRWNREFGSKCPPWGGRTWKMSISVYSLYYPQDPCMVYLPTLTRNFQSTKFR